MPTNLKPAHNEFPRTILAEQTCSEVGNTRAESANRSITTTFSALSQNRVVELNSLGNRMVEVCSLGNRVVEFRSLKNHVIEFNSPENHAAEFSPLKILAGARTFSNPGAVFGLTNGGKSATLHDAAGVSMSLKTTSCNNYNNCDPNFFYTETADSTLNFVSSVWTVIRLPPGKGV